MIVRLIGAAVLLVGLAPGQSQDAATPTGQTVTERKLVDHDFRFTLTAKRGWRVQDEKATRKITPDGVASLMKRPGLVMAVIVERLPGESTEEWAKAIRDGLPLENASNDVFEKITFCGQSAVRMVTSGRFREFDLRYQHIVFHNQEYLYQIICWGAAPLVKSDGSTFRPLVAAFTLQPGPVRGRTPDTKLADTNGVGWRIKDGHYANAAYGFAVAPRPKCRLIVGSELALLNESASVGLSDGTTNLLVIAERTVGTDEARLRTSLALDNAPGITAVDRRETIVIDGRALVLRHYRSGTPEMTLLHGLTLRDGVCLQLQAWYLRADEERARAKLPDLFGSLRFLDTASWTSLKRELSTAPDRTNLIGPNESLRRGRYRNFAHDWSWERPPGFWSVRIGQQARADDPTASMILEDKSTGLFASVWSFPHDGSLEKAQEQALDAYAGKAGETAQTKLGGQAALATDLTAEANGLAYVFRIHTVLWRGRAWAITFWGLSDNMAKAGPSVRAALAGVRFHSEGLEPSSHDKSGAVDYRFGFEIVAPEDDAQVQEMRIPAVQAIGRAIELRSGDDRYMVVAVCPNVESFDLQAFSDIVTSMVMPQISRGLAKKIEPREARGTLAGQPCIHRTWKLSEKQMRLSLVKRDATFFAVLVMTDDDAKLKRAETVFSFLP